MFWEALIGWCSGVKDSKAFCIFSTLGLAIHKKQFGILFVVFVLVFCFHDTCLMPNVEKYYVCEAH